MAVPTPKIDARDVAAIIREARALVPFYTPEWRAAEETDAGVALLKIFARLYEGLLRRLNEAPRKNFIAFLNMLGVKLLPAQPARAPLTFLLSTGAADAVVIPARTQATATPPEGGEPVVFETEKAILATPAQLQAVFSVVPSRDAIFDHRADILAGKTVELFAKTNVQEHSLYLGHDALFNLKGPVRLELTIVPLSSVLEQNAGQVRWEYYGEREHLRDGETVKVTDWFAFENAFIEADKLVLHKHTVDALQKVEINGIETYWIRCTVNPTHIQAVQGVEIDTIRVRVAPLAVSGLPAGVAPDMAFYNDTELELTRPFYPFGTRPRVFDAFYLASQEALSKKGVPIRLMISLCRVRVRAPKLRFPHPAGTQIAVASDATFLNFTTLHVEAAAGEHRIYVDTTDDLQLQGQILRLGAQDKREYVIVENVSDNVITLKGPLVFSHQRGTEVRRGAGLGLVPVTVLTADAAEENVCLQVESIVGLRDDDIIEIGDGGTREFHLISMITPSTEALLSWEYWNGRGWTALPGVQDTTNHLSISGEVVFTCPDDISTVDVIGQENYWIRTRITSGDYGREEFEFQDGKVISTPSFRPPFVDNVTIVYQSAPVALGACLSFNNRCYQDHTAASRRTLQRFRPFVPLDGRHQVLYLGFDPAPIKGPISVFFSLVEQAYFENNQPRLEWEYLRRREEVERVDSARLAVVDGTQHLTESGTVAFIGPPDLAREMRFGQALFWIRAVNVAHPFEPQDGPTLSRRSSRRVALADDAGSSPLALCEALLESFHPAFSLPPQQRETPPAPQVKGIFLNTAWATQAETIAGEILGSSTATANQAFTLVQVPVIAEAIRVNEISTLSESERQELLERPDLEVEQVTDETGQVTALWLRWRPIDDLAEAAATDRVYTIDRTFGHLRFGDGVHGMVPPVGRDNITATYQAGGGTSGNVGASQITALRTSIPFVDSVSNPEPAGGGSDTEPVESALERGPQTLKHRGRAVTADDFAALAREASRAVARVKVLPTFNDRGTDETGWVTVIIVPESQETRPMPSPQLRRRVMTYLRERAANVIAFPERVHVTGPTYVEVSIAAVLFPVSLERAPEIEAAALRQLQRFLHPLTGGYEGKGWEFGRLPCLSDFYALLEVLHGLDHADNLAITLRAVTPSGVPIGGPKRFTDARPVAVRIPEYALIYSGDHALTTQALR